jgi:phage terminase large subunit-like protein
MKAQDALEALPVFTSDKVGRYSKLELLGRKLRALKKSLAVLFTFAELSLLRYDWRYLRRPIQQAPATGWRTYFFCGGRGAGKTFAGSLATIDEAEADPDAKIYLIGPTYSEIIKTQIEGPSGILALSPPWFRPEYHKSRRLLIWPNGAMATWLPAEKPDKFRGHAASFIWLDEIVAYKYGPEAIREARAILRHSTPRMQALELDARMFVTTTPQPSATFEELLEDIEGMILANASTLENAANLDPRYVRYMRARQDTTEGKREVLGQLTFALAGSLFKLVDWDRSRVLQVPETFDVIVVSVDPSTGEKSTSDMHGISVVGFRTEADGLIHSYVLADLTMRGTPREWATAACQAYHGWKDQAKVGSTGKRQCWILVETNTGGKLVVQNVRLVDREVRIVPVRAKQSKAERAAPVSSLAEAGLVHMVGRPHQLEAQLSKFTGANGGHARDDRVDAMVWPISQYAVVQRTAAAGSSPAKAA